MRTKIVTMFLAAFTLSFGLSTGAAEIAFPSWMKVHSNGCFNLGDMMTVMAVGNGKIGATESFQNSKGVRSVAPDQQNTCFWKCDFRPWKGGEELCRIEKQLTVRGSDCVALKYQLVLPEPTTVVSSSFNLFLPAEAMKLSIDGKDFEIPAQYDRTTIYRGNAKSVRLRRGNAELEFSGNWFLSLTDLRKWKDRRILLAFHLGDKGKVKNNDSLEITITRTGVNP
ncbi:MAG: hypothetical protein PHS41_01655 [Victivallaceae bacterium]|nr:hypothetical protein [Victivallaceae bacterium]